MDWLTRPALGPGAEHAFFRANRSIVDFELRPHQTVTFLHEVDLTAVQAVRQRAATAGGVRPSYTALVVKAVALALRDVPYANRRVVRRAPLPFAGSRLMAFQGRDVAVACERDLPGIPMAVFMDVARRADETPLDELTTWLRALAESDADSNEQWRGFAWAITRLPHWLSTLLIRLPYLHPAFWRKWRGGAVLVSSPARYGVDAIATTWSWPLGVSFGLVRDRPGVRDGKVVVRPSFILTLNWDRRVMAGAQAARFFHRMVEVLENAEETLAPFLPAAAPERDEPRARSAAL